MLYRANRDGEIESIDPQRLAAVINSTKPAVVSVRTAQGDELTIADVAIDVRPNGIHILLDVPDAYMQED